MSCAVSCWCCLQVSGKTWKEGPSKRASADKNAVVNKHSSWEKKMQEKAQKKAFQEQKAAALEAIKAKRKVRHPHCRSVSAGWGFGMYRWQVAAQLCCKLL